MTTTNSIQAQYGRWFSDVEMKAMLKLRIPFLIQRINSLLPENQYAFDIHLRTNSELMVYHGGTCLLTIGFAEIEHGKISFKSPSYCKRQGCAEKFSSLATVTSIKEGDIEAVTNLAGEFLVNAVLGEKIVCDRYFKNRKEGYWSNRLSIEYGRNWAPHKEWLIIDREAVLGFKTELQKSAFYNGFRAKVQSVKQALQLSDPKQWGKLVAMNEGKDECANFDFGDELDFLAIGPEKQLLCIELKHGSYTSGIYWGPLQASVYRDAFSSQLRNISDSILKIVRQRVSLGLLPQKALERLPEDSFQSVEGILAVADYEPNARSTCWQKALTVNSELAKQHTAVKMYRSKDGAQWEGACTWN